MSAFNNLMRALFLVGCAVIVLGAIVALSWAEQQGPPARCYSFTNIKAEPWHQIVCVPVLIIAAVVTVLNTLKKLGGE